MTNYDDLIQLTPSDDFWTREPVVLPWRGNVPHNLSYQGDANTAYALYVDDIEVGVAVSSALGTVTIQAVLAQGDRLLRWHNRITGRTVSEFVISVRFWATYLQTIGLIFDEIETLLTQARSGLTSETAEAVFLEFHAARTAFQVPGDWSLEVVQNVVSSLVNIYRRLGESELGLISAISRLAGPTAFLVPRALYPRLVPEKSGFERYLYFSQAEPFPNANRIALRWVGTVVPQWLTAPGPWTNPPEPEDLCCTFDGSWDGGDITVYGTDANGNMVSDVFVVSLGNTVLGANRTVISSVTRVTLNLAGTTGNAYLGLATSRWLSNPRLGPLNFGGGASLTVNASQEVSWRSGLAVNASEDNTLVLGDTQGRDPITTIMPASTATTFSGTNVARLYVARNNQVYPIPVSLPETPANIVSAINNTINRAKETGATMPQAVLTFDATALVASDYIEITDGAGTTERFEYRPTGIVTSAGYIAWLGASTALARQSLAVAINRSGLRVEAFPHPTNATQIIVRGLDSRQITVAYSGTSLDFVPTAASPQNFTGTATALVIASTNADAVLGESAISFSSERTVSLPEGPGDGHFEVFGLSPQRRWALGAPIAFSDRSVTLSSATGLPIIPNLLLHPPTAQTLGTASSLEDPDLPCNISVIFRADWSGNSIVVTGTDPDGLVVTEQFDYAENIIASGIGNASAPFSNTMIQLDSGEFSADIQANDWLEIGGELRRILYVSTGERDFGLSTADVCRQLVIASTFSVAPTSDDWRILRNTKIDGVQIFETIVSSDQTGTPPGSGTATWELQVVDASERGLHVRIGRGFIETDNVNLLPVNNEAVGSATVAANQLATISWVAAQQSWFGGGVLISGSVAYAGSNNGMHKIAFSDPTRFAAGLSFRCFHENKSFAPLPGTGNTDYTSVGAEAITASIYARGEEFIILRNDAGELWLEHAALSVNDGSGLLELEADLNWSASNNDIGLGTLVLDVDARFALPAGDTATDSVTVIPSSAAPNHWRFENADSVSFTIPRHLGDGRLTALSTGTSDARLITKRKIERFERGWYLVTTASVAHNNSAALTARIDVSFDAGQNWIAGTGLSFAGVVNNAYATQAITHRTLIPWTATEALIRIVFVTPAAANVSFAVERFSSTLETLSTYPVVRDASNSFYRLLAYRWQPNEPSNLELAADNFNRLTTSAHLKLDSQDISAYSSGIPTTLRGIYRGADWASATLENMAATIAAPDYQGYVSPTQESAQIVELAIVAPSNALISVDADRDGPFPQEPNYYEVLTEDGLPLPNEPTATTRASATIGAGADGTITITAQAWDTGPESYTIEVIIGGSTERANVYQLGSSGTYVVRLAGTPLPGENTAAQIADLLNLLSGISASASGNGSGVLSSASGPTAFSGATACPWHWVSDNEIHIDAGFFNSAATYRLKHDARMRVTTDVRYLGASYANYRWLADAAVYIKQLFRSFETEIEYEPLIVTNRETKLAWPVAKNTTPRIFVAGKEVVRGNLSLSADRQTITLRQDPGTSIVYANYTGLKGVSVPAANYRLERRTGATAGAVATAPWYNIQVGDPMPTGVAYFQLRVSFMGVTRQEHVRLYGLGHRGIAL